MSLQFRTVRLGSPRQPAEGLRIGAVRFLPRGVPKSDYAQRDLFDVWLPTLAPSRALFQGVRAGRVAANVFERRYRREMNATEPRQVIQLLSLLARQTSLSVGCYCKHEAHCHRRVLGHLIREAAGESGQRSLAKRSVYTIVHPDRLAEIEHQGGGAGELSEQRTWTTALSFWHEAQQAGERLPVIFGDATDCSRLLAWGQLDEIDLTGEGTGYRVSGLQPIRGRHSPQELTLCSTGEAIAPGFIRPYALVQTPTFVR